MMDSTEQPKPSSEENVMIIIGRSSRNILVAKLFILLGLTILGSHFFVARANQQYEKGRELTQEQYLEDFDLYKGALLSSKQYKNPVIATIAMLITLSFLIGSYELLSVVIGLLIGKVVKR